MKNEFKNLATAILISGLFLVPVFCSAQTNKNLKREGEASLENSIDNSTGATVIYTKPNRSLTAPKIQMLASFISLDSIYSYRFRIEIFTRRTVLNSEKVFIISSSEIHVFDAKKDNVNTGSVIVNEFMDWGCCYQSGCMTEGYLYTFILESSKEDFIKIISSNDIKVFFSNKGNPDEYITDSDISKMNDLYTYLKAVQNIDLLNL